MTPAMLTLQWETVALSPAGYAADRITFSPSVKLPAGWQAATALDGASRSGDTISYAPVDFETLVDSPMFAGAHAKVYDLDPGADEAVRLNVFADDAKFLAYANGLPTSAAEIKKHAVPAGISCRFCERTDCNQRAAPSYRFAFSL